jgi:hypothetical protein
MKVPPTRLEPGNRCLARSALDDAQQLARFMAYFNGNLARSSGCFESFWGSAPGRPLTSSN